MVMMILVVLVVVTVVVAVAVVEVLLLAIAAVPSIVVHCLALRLRHVLLLPFTGHSCPRAILEAIAEKHRLRFLMIGPVRDNGGVAGLRRKGLLSGGNAGKDLREGPAVEEFGAVPTETPVHQQ